MKTFKMGCILILPASLLACWSHKTTVNEGFAAAGDAEKPRLICSSDNCKYGYIGFINGEPIGGGTRTGIDESRVYPLHKGTHLVRGEMNLQKNQTN